MTLGEFAGLELDEQVDYAEKNGVCVADDIIEDIQVLLYQVEDFYVEIKYNKDTSEVLRVSCKTSNNVSDNYLKEVNISKYYKNVPFVPFTSIYKNIDVNLLRTAIQNY